MEMDRREEGNKAERKDKYKWERKRKERDEK